MADDWASNAAQGAAAGSAFGPWGAAIGGIGGALLGGLFSKDEAKDERERQYEFAKSGIQWRVQDAKAAGVHPLFALGASPAAYSPVLSGAGGQIAQGLSQAGQNVARAAMASQDDDLRRELMQAQIDAAQGSASRDYAQSALALAQERLLSQGQPRGLPGPSVYGGSGQGPSSAGARSSVEDSPVFPNVLDRMPPAVKIDIPKIALSDNLDKSTTPGMHPSWDTQRMWPRGDGSYFRFMMPSKETAEKMEAMGEVLTPYTVLRKNVEEFGLPWLHELFGPGFETMKELAGIQFAEDMRVIARDLYRRYVPSPKRGIARDYGRQPDWRWSK